MCKPETHVHRLKARIVASIGRVNNSVFNYFVINSKLVEIWSFAKYGEANLRVKPKNGRT